jgi:DNA-binding NtrC family response regulator
MDIHMLIVDDEAPVRSHLSEHYRKMGYAVQTAGSAEEAEDILATQPFQILILDIKLPGRDGPELLQQVQSEYPMLHTIMITGYVTQDNLLASWRHGAETCIFKPLSDLSELDEAVQRGVQAIQRWLDKLAELKRMGNDAREPVAETST